MFWRLILIATAQTVVYGTVYAIWGAVDKELTSDEVECTGRMPFWEYCVWQFTLDLCFVALMVAAIAAVFAVRLALSKLDIKFMGLDRAPAIGPSLDLALLIAKFAAVVHVMRFLGEAVKSLVNYENYLYDTLPAKTARAIRECEENAAAVEFVELGNADRGDKCPLYSKDLEAMAPGIGGKGVASLPRPLARHSIRQSLVHWIFFVIASVSAIFVQAVIEYIAVLATKGTGGGLMQTGEVKAGPGEKDRVDGDGPGGEGEGNESVGEPVGGDRENESDNSNSKSWSSWWGSNDNVKNPGGEDNVNNVKTTSEKESQKNGIVKSTEEIIGDDNSDKGGESISHISVKGSQSGEDDESDDNDDGDDVESETSISIPDIGLNESRKGENNNTENPDEKQNSENDVIQTSTDNGMTGLGWTEKEKEIEAEEKRKKIEELNKQKRITQIKVKNDSEIDAEDDVRSNVSRNSKGNASKKDDDGSEKGIGYDDQTGSDKGESKKSKGNDEDNGTENVSKNETSNNENSDKGTKEVVNKRKDEEDNNPVKNTDTKTGNEKTKNSITKDDTSEADSGDDQQTENDKTQEDVKSKKGNDHDKKVDTKPSSVDKKDTKSETATQKGDSKPENERGVSSDKTRGTKSKKTGREGISESNEKESESGRHRRKPKSNEKPRTKTKTRGKTSAQKSRK